MRGQVPTSAIDLAIEEVPTSAAGERFVYSDINYILLGDIVRRVSGQPLNEFARKQIFEPLGMKDTMFLPPESLRPRIAPTEKCTPFGWPCEGSNLQMLRGVVHDPTARRMGGVAGHAGLFGTAADVSIFCQMLLNKGTYRGTRVLSPLTVDKMTTGRRRPWRPRARVGHRHGVLVEPRRAAPDRIVRPYRLHRDSLWIDPAHGPVRGVHVEPRAP